MTVESSYICHWDCYAYSDCLNNLVPGFQPMRSKTKTKTNIVTFKHDFSCALSKLQVIARTCESSIVLFNLVVIGSSNFFVIAFFYGHLKSTLDYYSKEL